VNHAKLGNWLHEVNENEKAEQHLLMSLYLTPHLLKSRYNLMNLYLALGIKPKAVYWAKALLEYPIKVQNQRALILKDSANRVLKRLH